MSPFLEQLLAILMKMLQDCPEPAEQKRKWLREPKRVHKALLFFKAIAAGMSLPEFRQGMKELEAMQAEATDAQLSDFVASASAFGQAAPA